jgi:hypothetical protein
MLDVNREKQQLEQGKTCKYLKTQENEDIQQQQIK